MRYYVTIAGRVVEVDLKGDHACVDGRTVTAESVPVPGSPIRHLLVDGRSFVLAMRPGAARGEWDIQLNGHQFEAEVVDERTRSIRQVTGAAAAPQGPKPVRAPMPGLVVRVEVEPGQAVQAGDGVAIIEAMKMENELKAEASGIVSKVLVSNGEAVEKGAVLVEFEVGNDG
jgi:biotin carboxyl carrier protein